MPRRTILAPAFLCLMALAPSALSQKVVDNCPFGLEWGMTVQDAKDLGVEMQKSGAEGRLTIYSAESLPKNLSIAESYALVFDSQFSLIKIKMVSNNIENDPYGTEGKEKYSDLKHILVTKYGPPEEGMSVELIGLALYDESDEFYQCLAYSGCGYWMAGFTDKTSGMIVGLQLKGLSRGKGYIVLSYEGPLFSDAVNAHKDDVTKTDDDAL